MRPKNVRNILLKNVIDACISAIAWWAVGDAFAYGSSTSAGTCDDNPFIGAGNFFSSNVHDPTYFARWIFGFGFSATAATIVSGAVSERVQFRSYLIYTVLITSFVYPVVVHWVWSNTGWLSARRIDCATGDPSPLFSGTNGFIDFAGSGVVHMVGGGMALVGAIISGPRLGRFHDGHVVLFENANTSQMVLGTLILWLGWYGFNAGSTGCMVGCMYSASVAAASTTIAIASGGLTCLLASVLLGSPGDIGVLLNGILAGAVSITASCALVKLYAAFVIGAVGGGVYLGASKMLLRLKVDDPLDASAVHFFAGLWGVLAAGLFPTENNVKLVYGYAEGWGGFYGGGGKQFGMQLLGALAISAWSLSWAVVIFYGLRRFGCLRVPKDSELQGLDIAQGVGSGQLLGCLNHRFGTKD